MRKNGSILRGLLVALFLVVCGAAFAGGGKGESTSASAPAVAGAKPETNLKISVGFTMADINADEMGKWIQEKFNMTLELVSTEGDKLSLLAAADQLPDAFEGTLGGVFFNQLKTDEFIRTIPEAVLTKYPSSKRYADGNEAIAAYKKLTGNYYSLPREVDVDNPTRFVESPLYYRADWLKKLGLAVPTNTTELYNVLKAYTVSDPDGNGKADTYGTTGWLWQVNFIPWCDMYSWVKEDGKWIPGCISKNMVEGLVFYNRLYKEKILDPEFAVAKAKDMFYTGKVGMINAGGSEYWLWRVILVGFGASNTGVDPFEAVKILPPIPKEAGGTALWPRAVNAGGTLFNSRCGDDKMSRLLQFFEWSLSPEGRDFSLYGFLDKDYILKDGKAVSILPNKETVYGQQKALFEVYPSVQLFNFVRWGVKAATPILNPTIPLTISEVYKQESAMLGANLAPVNVLIENLMTPAREKSNVDLDAVETEFGRIVSSDDPRAEYEQYRNKLLKVNGLQQVIDEMNAEIVRQGLDK